MVGAWQWGHSCGWCAGAGKRNRQAAFVQSRNSKIELGPEGLFMRRRISCVFPGFIERQYITRVVFDRNDLSDQQRFPISAAYAVCDVSKWVVAGA